MGASKSDRDASRAERKAKKRKAEDAIPDLPGDEEGAEPQQPKDKSSKKRKHGEVEDNADIEKGEGEAVKKVKKVKKEKKDKKENKTKGAEANGDRDAQEDDEEINGKAKKSKKIKKTAKPVVEEDGSAEAEDPKPSSAVPEGDEQPRKSKKERVSEEISTSTGDVKVGEEESQADSTKAKKNNRNRDKKRKAAANSEENVDEKSARFIVFIGNLPFTATTSSIEKHFAAVHPKSIRHLTKKEDPSKSRGCAFVEFEGYDHMKTCLKLFHHSNFDDGLSAPRKINVELTAGGGGKTKHRTEKIGEKNQKLNEQRIRRMHEEEKAKLVKKDAAIDHNAVHPSRRARVPDVS